MPKPRDPTTPDASGAPGVRVFISYAHVDEALRAGLRSHLSALERDGLVQAWDDRQILGGDAWADEIDARLDDADVVLLLVTADFINSEYCYGKELTRALERNADGSDRAIVIPVILRKCDWEHTPFARLQALPPGARPLADWPTPDDYYTAVVKGLRQRLQRLVEPDTRWADRMRRRLRDPLWWQQPRVWASALGALVLAAAAAGGWWQEAARSDALVAEALQHLRSGRAQDAVDDAQQACQSWVPRNACFVLDKARLGLALESPDGVPLEQFAARVNALKAAAPADPDLLFFAAQLALREQQPERHAQARSDITRAIALAEGRFPEAHFYLANLEMFAGRHADALPLLDRAMDPAVNRVALPHYLNARAYARAQTGDLRGAQQDYEQSAELGSILSRIELAELLWTVSDFDRASDQLLAASKALGAHAQAPPPLTGRNLLPWAFQTRDAGPAVLRQAQEKRCFARWMHSAGLALAGRPETTPPPSWDDCGPEATRIAAAVAYALARASGAGMNDTGRDRAQQFAGAHRLSLAAGAP